MKEKKKATAPKKSSNGVFSPEPTERSSSERVKSKIAKLEKGMKLFCCNASTAQMIQVKPLTAYEKGKSGGLEKYYYVESLPSEFYLSAKNTKEAVKLFEEFFAEMDENMRLSENEEVE